MHYVCLRLLTVLTASTSLNPTNEHFWTAPIFLPSLQTQKQTGMIQHNNHNNTHFHCRVQLFKRIRTTGCKKFVSHIIRNNLKVHWMGKSVSKKLQTKMVSEIWSPSTVKQLWLVIMLEMNLVGGQGDGDPLLTYTGMCCWTGYGFQGLFRVYNFIILASWIRCLSRPIAFKRVWRLATRGLHSSTNTFFKTSNSMTLVWKITYFCIQNEMNQGSKIRPVMLSRVRLWRPQLHTSTH